MNWLSSIKTHKLAGILLFATLSLSACDEAIVLKKGAVNKSDKCGEFRTKISAARQSELQLQAKNAVIGAAFGAVIGAALAGPDDWEKGAAQGAALGGLAGYGGTYYQQIQKRSSDANSLLKNVNADAIKENTLVTEAGKAAKALGSCRQTQIADLRSRVTTGKVEKSLARSELRQITSWVKGDNQIISAAFNGIGERVEAYVDVSTSVSRAKFISSNASIAPEMTLAAVKKLTPAVSRVQTTRNALMSRQSKQKELLSAEIEALDVLLG